MTPATQTGGPRGEGAAPDDGPAERVTVSLACTECESRNYRTTRKASHKGQIELKKFCPACRRHTVHKETK